MNENLNLVEILKDCPKGTKLYSTVFGDVTFLGLIDNPAHPICIEHRLGCWYLISDGRLMPEFDGECTLFPSKEQRDWSKFKVKKSKFDPNTFQPFDKVLVRDSQSTTWFCKLFSHIRDIPEFYRYATNSGFYRYCIPYNEDTKHLVGTTDEASEFYRYWED